jgi:hypothetical protein
MALECQLGSTRLTELTEFGTRKIMERAYDKKTNKMKEYADRKCVEASAFVAGDMVWLDSRNLISLKRCKLNPLYIGPFRVLARYSDTYRIKLLRRLGCLHPTFPVSMLKRTHTLGRGHSVTELFPAVLQFKI